MFEGWVKIQRAIMESEIFSKAKYLQLWLYCQLKANHEEKKIIFNGHSLLIKVGQFVAGRHEISRETRIPETTVERILDYLENGQFIGQQKNNKFRLITVLNYDGKNKSGQLNGSKTDNKRTTNGQQTDTNKNEENDKNEKKYIYLDDQKFRETFQAFREMRKVKKKPLSNYAEKLLLDKLHQFPLSEALARTQRSIENCWTGIIFPGDLEAYNESQARASPLTPVQISDRNRLWAEKTKACGRCRDGWVTVSGNSETYCSCILDLVEKSIS